MCVLLRLMWKLGQQPSIYVMWKGFKGQQDFKFNLEVMKHLIDELSFVLMILVY
jgi:hypothetical protein